MGAAAGLVGASLLLPRRSVAAGEPVSTQSRQNGPGFYRMKAGDVTVTLLSDGTFPLSGYPLFGANASEAEVNAALAASFISPSKVTAHVNTLVIESGKDVTLIDAGCGNAFGPTTGHTVPRLVTAGIMPESITKIFITHMHRDHVGGLLVKPISEIYPKATVAMSTAEHAFWSSDNPVIPNKMDDATKAAFTQSAKDALKAIGDRLELVDGEQEIASGVLAVPAPGHTPGHCAVQVGSGSTQLLFIADGVHHAAIQLQHPEWHVAFDADADAAVVSRKMLLDRASADKVLISGSHLPFPAFGHMKTGGTGYEWVPIVWEWQ